MFITLVGLTAMAEERSLDIVNLSVSCQSRLGFEFVAAIVALKASVALFGGRCTAIHTVLLQRLPIGEHDTAVLTDGGFFLRRHGIPAADIIGRIARRFA